MNEVFEPLAVNEPSQKGAIAAGLPPMDFPAFLRARPPVERHTRGAWSSSLSASDLQCLLQVIEGELIPQLVSGYSPARCAPRDASPE